MDLEERMETCESSARSTVSSPQGENSKLHLSSPEEVDKDGIDEDSPPQSPQYDDLLNLVTCAICNKNPRSCLVVGNYCVLGILKSEMILVLTSVLLVSECMCLWF